MNDNRKGMKNNCYNCKNYITDGICKGDCGVVGKKVINHDIACSYFEALEDEYEEKDGENE